MWWRWTQWGDLNSRKSFKARGLAKSGVKSKLINCLKSSLSNPGEQDVDNIELQAVYYSDSDMKQEDINMLSKVEQNQARGRTKKNPNMGSLASQYSSQKHLVAARPVFTKIILHWTPHQVQLLCKRLFKRHGQKSSKKTMWRRPVLHYSLSWKNDSSKREKVWREKKVKLGGVGLLRGYGFGASRAERNSCLCLGVYASRSTFNTW